MLSLFIFIFLPFLLAISGSPYDDFTARAAEYKIRAMEQTGCGWWQDILRLHFKHEKYCEDGLINTRILDDFELAGVAWITMMEWDNPLLSDRVKNTLLSRLTTMPWWLDEQGSFDGNMQYWSENHQMGWYGGQYLVGHAFSSNPDLANILFHGMNNTGHTHYTRGKDRLQRWLDYRGRFGFSEYNSDTYAPIAYNPLVTVAALAPDREIKTLAAMITFLQLFDWIIASHKGVIGSPRGRAYDGGKLLENGAQSQSIHSALWLFTGEGSIEDVSLGRKDVIMTLLAMEVGFEVPEVLLEVAESLKHGTHELRERFAISSSVDEATLEGIGFTTPDECVFWFGNGGYFSPTTARCMFIVGDAYNLWDVHPIWQDIKPALILWQTDPNIIDQVAAAAEPIGGGPVLGRSNVYTWRTESYMLSSIQNYHGGKMAGQQHAWQLTIDPDVTRTVFTTQPTNNDQKHDPYWVGGILPKIGQHQNTLIAIYNPALLDNLVFDTSFTHAHFFREGYEQVVEQNNWVMAKHGDTYVALYSAQPLTWADQSSEFANRELIAQGKKNVWICHVGEQSTSGDFESFVELIATSHVDISMIQRDSLLRCLEDNACLTGNVLETMSCLSSGTCDLSQHLTTSELSQCLMDHNVTTLYEAVKDAINSAVDGSLELFKQSHAVKTYVDCLSVADEDVAVKWYLNGTIFSLGWTEPFKVQVLDSAPVVIEDDFFMRYSNSFSKTEWGSKKINIEAGNKSLSLDLDSIRFL